MEEEIKFEIIGREIIKPSSPTPSHLKSFKLSLFDQIAPPIYTALVLFYTNNVNNVLTSDQKSSHLKKSLSEALTLYYPLAGRVIDNTTIECHDVGARYLEAKFNGLLSTFLEQQKDEALTSRFLPAEIGSPEAGTWPLLVVQATFFDCGGVAIGVCVSHKLADAATLGIFLKTWACTAVPDFYAASHFYPGNNLSFAPPTSMAPKQMEKSVAKRYVFDKSKIAALKAKTASDTVKQPTRVEVVTALVWRCLMGSASQSTSSGSSSTAPVKKPRYSLLMQCADLRKRVEPPFSQNSVGNLVGCCALVIENDVYESSSEPLECQLQDLVATLRQGIKEFGENKIARRFKRSGDGGLIEAAVEHCREVGELYARNDAQQFMCSSWCNFDLYEVDLGLGKPVYAAIPIDPCENSIMLMDTRERDGVELILTLSKENMALFENQLEIHMLSFSSSS